jgi:glutathione peroxidase
MTTLHEFRLTDIDGEPRSLDEYRGKVVLVVNVASKCGLTPHYEGLQKLHASHAARGFSVLGFPCNQFAGQEPGSDADVKEFACSRYGVEFPLFSKLEVNGAGRAPLYAWLTAEPTQPHGPGDIQWNFEKFLVGRDGRVLARYGPRTTPEELAADVDAALMDDVVTRFWRGIDSHDWDLVASTLSDDFVRIGMRDDEADTSRGKAEYLRFVSGVIGRFDRHELAARKVFRSADGRTAVAECIEKIHPPGEPELVMHFINILEIDPEGLISKLDIYWKTPPRMPPAWITPKAILGRAQ